MSIMKKLLPIVLMGAMLTFPKIADATEKWQYCSGVMATDWHYSTEKNYSHEQDVLSVVDYLKEMNLRGYDPRDFNLKELRENVYEKVFGKEFKGTAVQNIELQKYFSANLKKKEDIENIPGSLTERFASACRHLSDEEAKEYSERGYALTPAD